MEKLLLILGWLLTALISIILYHWSSRDFERNISYGISFLFILTGPVGLISVIFAWLILEGSRRNGKLPKIPNPFWGK